MRERAAASLSRCGAWREGSCKPPVALHIPSSACSIPARFPGVGLVLWDLTGTVLSPCRLLCSQQKAFGVQCLLMDVLADTQMSNLFPPDQSESTDSSSST